MSFHLRSFAFHVLLLTAFITLPLKGSAQTHTPVILWPTPAPISFRTQLSPIQLNAYALAGIPVAVPLSGVYNVVGITMDGFAFIGGYDDSSEAFASSTLGGSLSWQDIQFPIGPPNAPDAVTSTTIPLPAGSFGRLMLLGSLVNNEIPPTARFVVTYTDGTTATFTQSMSDWVNPMSYPGELIVASMPFRHNQDGTIDPNSVSINGYQFTLDPTRTPQSLTMPQDRDVVLLSLALVPPVVPGSFVYLPGLGTILPSGGHLLSTTFTPADPQDFGSASASVSLTVQPPPMPVVPAIVWPQPAPILQGTALSALQLDASATTSLLPVQVPLNQNYRINALYADGSVYKEKGFDKTSRAFSATALGPSVAYAGGIFPLGPLAVPDATTATTLALPAGSFTSLEIIGAAGSAPEPAQSFVITYADGSSTSTPVSLSPWTAPQNFSGETIVAATTYADTAQGNRVAGTFDLYGYTIPLDSSRTVASLTLPANTDVLVLAAALTPGPDMVVRGSFVYAPAAGTLPLAGTDPLSLRFTPVDSTDFSAVSAYNTLVSAPNLVVTANNATRVYGTANPAFSGSYSGGRSTDVFNESFSTPASLLSSAGSYPIIPALSGPNLSLYSQSIRDGVLTVSRAPVIASLTPSTAGTLQNQPVTLTASVATTTAGVPTGSVQFLTNGVVLGSANLNAGTAALSVPMPVGSNVLTFIYSGDVNFLPLTGSSPTAIVVAPLDFTIQAVGASTASLSLGQQATFTVRIAPLHGVFAGNVAISAAGLLPPLATDAFSTSVIPVSASATDVTFAVFTRTLAAKDRPTGSMLAFCLLLGLPLIALRRVRRSAAFKALIFLCAISGMGMLSGCGSGYHSATYPLVITASDGTVTHTLPLTLQVVPPH